MERSRIFHIARADDWAAAQTAGEYRISTVGRTLEEEGFIHCSASPEQGTAVLRSFYAAVDEPLVVLTIATERVRAEIRYELPEGATAAFPHIYGPLPIDAVISVTPVRRAGGRSDWPHLDSGR